MSWKFYSNAWRVLGRNIIKISSNLRPEIVINGCNNIVSRWFLFYTDLLIKIKYQQQTTEFSLLREKRRGRTWLIVDISVECWVKFSPSFHCLHSPLHSAAHCESPEKRLARAPPSLCWIIVSLSPYNNNYYYNQNWVGHRIKTIKSSILTRINIIILPPRCWRWPLVCRTKCPGRPGGGEGGGRGHGCCRSASEMTDIVDGNW